MPSVYTNANRDHDTPTAANDYLAERRALMAQFRAAHERCTDLTGQWPIGDKHLPVVDASLAKWHSMRTMFGTIETAIGFAPVRSDREQRQFVRLRNADGDLLLFWNLAWGYSGSAPQALAAIVADALDWPLTYCAEFMRYMPAAQDWLLRRGDLPK